MKDRLSDDLFDELRKYLASRFCWNFTAKQKNEVTQKIGFAAKDLEFPNTTRLVQWMLDNNLTDHQLEVLAGYLTVGETYFLREKKSFDFLEKIYLPDLVKKRQGKNQQIRIWSAGCATGEEPYSIAITLRRAIPDIKNWNISILATDINSTFLEKAKKGIYTKWSFRNNPKWLIDNYFGKVGKSEFQILPEIKRMVTFFSHNLAKDNYPSLANETNAMDIIFCRNVLIYFSQAKIKEVTDHLYNSLIRGGILIVSPVEMTNSISSKFDRVNYSGFFVYKKDLRRKKKSNKQKSKVLIPAENNQVLHKVQKIKPTATISIKEEKIQRTNTKVREEILTKNKTKEVEIPITLIYEQAEKLIEQGLFAETEELLSNIVTGDKENLKPLISLLAKTKANLGKLNEARDLCEKVLNIDKTDHNIYYLLATIMHELGDDDETISCLNRAIYLNSDFVLAHFLLGNLTLKSGKRSNSKKHFRNALDILSKIDPDEILPESDGLTAGRFKEIIQTINLKKTK